MYKNFFHRRNAVLGNDEFCEDFEQTRVVEEEIKPIVVVQKQCFDNPNELPHVATYRRQELKMTGANPLKKDVAAFLEVTHCTHKAALLLKKNHFIIQTLDSDAANQLKV